MNSDFFVIVIPKFTFTQNFLYGMNLQVKESLLQKCREVEQVARDQATDNAILDQLRKVVDTNIYISLIKVSLFLYF